MKRRQVAWLIALVFLLGSTLACYAILHEHTCVDESACPLCQYLHSMRRYLAITLVLSATFVACCRLDALVTSSFYTPLVSRKVRMNN